MPANTLLCIHRDPTELSLLQEHGYELATATNGCDGLRLFMSQPVDAVVLEYHLGLLDGAAIADEIKHVRPDVPIVMLADHVELPADALKSVDALVVKSDGPHFLLATVHFVLSVRPARHHKVKLGPQTPAHLRRSGRSREAADPGHMSASLASPKSASPNPATGEHEKDAPLSPEVWRDIRKGTIRF
jgi:DNA-binding response OmpR family regulator